MYSITTRLRGNPIFLATLLIAFLSFGLGFYLSKPGESVLAGAFVGAAVSLLVSALTAFLGEPERADIPFPFKAAALADFNERGYYRAESTIVISRTQDGHIDFIMTSTIVKFRDNVGMKAPTIRAPAGLILDSISHKIDGSEIASDCEVDLKRDAKEVLIVKYSLENPSLSISDAHTWDCPVDGFSLEMSAPIGFQVGARTLSNRSLADEGDMRVESRSYREKRPAFSHQGFIWTMTKLDP